MFFSKAYGRPQAGVWLPTNATLPNTSCAKTAGALHYYERSNGSVRAV